MTETADVATRLAKIVKRRKMKGIQQPHHCRFTGLLVLSLLASCGTAWPSTALGFTEGCTTTRDAQMGLSVYVSPYWSESKSGAFLHAQDITMLRAQSDSLSKIEVFVQTDRESGWMHIHSAYANGNKLRFAQRGTGVHTLVGKTICRERFAAILDRDDCEEITEPLVIGFRGSKGSFNIAVPPHAFEGFLRYLEQQEAPHSTSTGSNPAAGATPSIAASDARPVLRDGMTFQEVHDAWGEASNKLTNPNVTVWTYTFGLTTIVSLTFKDGVLTGYKRGLSASLSGAIMAQGKQGKKKEREEQLQAGQAFLQKNPDFFKNKVTYAKAVESGLIPAPVSEIFWEGMQKQEGMRLLGKFFDPSTGPLAEMEQNLISVGRTEDPGAAFDGAWREHVMGPLEGNFHGQETANRAMFQARQAYLEDINKKYTESARKHAGESSVNNVSTILRTALESNEPETATGTYEAIASSVQAMWADGQLGQAKGGTPVQPKVIQTAAMRHLEELTSFEPGLPRQQQLNRLEHAYAVAVNMMGDEDQKGMVYGSADKGYKPVFRGGPHEEEMRSWLDTTQGSIDNLTSLVDMEWSQKQGPEVRQLATRGLYSALVTLREDNPHAHDMLAAKWRELTAPGEEVNAAVLKAFFDGQLGEGYWTDEMSKTLLNDERGIAEFGVSLDAELKSQATAVTQEDAELSLELQNLLQDKEYGAAGALIEANKNKVPKAWYESAYDTIEAAQKGATLLQDPEINRSWLATQRSMAALAARAETRKVVPGLEDGTRVDRLNRDLQDAYEAVYTAAAKSN